MVSLHSYVSGWLQGLEDSGTPLVVGTVAIPLSLLNFASEQLGQVISQRFKLLAAVSLGLPLTYLAYQCLDYVVQVVLGVFHVLYEGLGYFSTLWVRIQRCLFPGFEREALKLAQIRVEILNQGIEGREAPH